MTSIDSSDPHAITLREVSECIECHAQTECGMCGDVFGRELPGHSHVCGYCQLLSDTSSADLNRAHEIAVPKMAELFAALTKEYPELDKAFTLIRSLDKVLHSSVCRGGCGKIHKGIRGSGGRCDECITSDERCTEARMVATAEDAEGEDDEKSECNDKKDNQQNDDEAAEEESEDVGDITDLNDEHQNFSPPSPSS